MRKNPYFAKRDRSRVYYIPLRFEGIFACAARMAVRVPIQERSGMALTHDEVAALRPDMLSPADTTAKVVAVGQAKSVMPLGRRMVSAMLAGAFIAFGGMFFCLVLADSSLPFALQRLLGGACFCLGLALVLCCGAELFTGNMLMACATAQGKVRVRAMLGNWATVWLGNFAGALVAVALVFMAGTAAMNGGAVGETFVSVAAGKVSADWVTLFFKGIMCNVLVALAVWVGHAARTVTDKVVGIMLPIAAFVACGFEHCVANMFFLPMGLALNSLGVGAAGAVTFGGMFFNLSAVTLGNIVGGVAVGLSYWFIYRKHVSAA